jgi:hypothetical protein
LRHHDIALKDMSTAKPKDRRRNATLRAGALLSGAAGKLYRKQGFAHAEVLTDWPRVVGERLADATAPQKLTRDGTLTVKVTPGFALELQHMEPQVLERIATYFGHRAVKRLKLVQGVVARRPANTGPEVRELTADEAAALGDRLAPVEDEDIKAALDRLGRAMLGARTRLEDKT